MAVRLISLLLVLLPLLLVTSSVPAPVRAAEEPAKLVVDLSPGGNSADPAYSDETGANSSPRSFVTAADGVTYFVARDPSNGRELWRTDGTPSGTRLVRDITPGYENSFNDHSYSKELVTMGTTVYFAIQSQLWKSDGTEAGTQPVTQPFEQNSYSTGAPFVQDLTPSGNRLFCSTEHSAYANTGPALWVTDGTASGTVKLKDLNPIAIETVVCDVAGTVYFTHNNQIWKSDGTIQGTVLFRDVGPSSLARLGRRLVWTEDYLAGDLWASDGTAAGTVRLAESSVDRAIRNDGTLFFGGTRNGVQGLYRSDGTQAGTSLVTSAYGAMSAFPLDGWLLFSRSGDTPSTTALWRINENGTGAVKLIEAGPNVYFGNFRPVGGRGSHAKVVIWRLRRCSAL